MAVQISLSQLVISSLEQRLFHQPLTASFTKPPNTVLGVFFLLLPILAPSWMENTRQIYYFKTSQTTQCLGEEFLVLILSNISFHLPWPQLIEESTNRRGPKTYISAAFLLAPKPLLKIFFLHPFSSSWYLEVPPFSIHPAIGFCLLYLHNQEPIRESTPPPTKVLATQHCCQLALLFRIQ